MGQINADSVASHGNLPDIPLIIDGVATKSSPESTFNVYSHAAGEVVYTAQSANVEAAQRAAEAASTAFATWKYTNAIVRRDLLFRVANKMVEKTEDLVHSQMLETSCNESWARFNVSYAIDLLQDLASRVTSISGEIPPTQDWNHMALVLKQPMGVILTIAPWNAAVILATRAVAGRIAAGCCVVFKASELCPQTHHILSRAFWDAGLPQGVLNVIQTQREDAAATTEALIAHRAVRKIEFIGSRTIGNIIGQMAAKYTKPVFMELGGKAPAIVLSDADLNKAADLCLTGMTAHHGQICMSTERILVQDTIASAFCALLKEKAGAYDAGLPVTRVGLNASSKNVVAAGKLGAQFIIGGPWNDEHSLRPTLLTGVDKDMAIFDEESFGPSASLYTFNNDAEAIAIANGTEYGLNAAIRTTDLERGIKMAREIEAGQVHLNCTTNYDEAVTLPIGEMKASGWGRSNGSWSLNEYLDL
ncbi:hypothetical protein LTR49_025580 [Elasticomyces elasticus]|nr:hypothetical protein LTR49_025580 [Elasticomyces elasticus]